MGLVQNLQLLILKLVCLMGWLSSFVFAQFDISEGVTGSVDFPALGITCLANLAVFVTSLIRGRLDLEIGARDVLDIVVSPKLKKIDGITHGVGLITSTQESQNVASKERVGIQKMKDFFQWLLHRLDVVPERVSVGIQKMKEVFQWFRHRLDIVLRVREEEEEGLPTASIEEGDVEEVRLRTSSGEEIPVKSVAVVMLSNNTSNLSIREFMKSNAPIAGSILLQFFVLQRAIHNFGDEEVPISPCQCTLCNCVVFWSVEEITNILAANGMVRTLKRFPNSLCLIPCRSCLTNDCHRRGEVQQLDEQRERETTVVSEILDDIGARSINTEEHICICIPILHSDKPDVWTELLLRSLRSKDAEGRGVRVSVMASEALEGYLSGRRRGSSKSLETVEYNIVSFIVPRLTEIVINVVLTFWFRVDGFSSSLVARRAVRDYLVDSKGSGFAATAFLTKAAVKSDFNNTKVCQVLTFRGDFLGIKTLSFIVGAVNLICSLGWAILIGFEADISPPLGKPRLAVIVAAVGFALSTDSVIFCIHHGIFNCCLLISFVFVLLWFSNYLDAAIAILVIVCSLLSWKKKLFLSVMILEIVYFVLSIFVFRRFENAILVIQLANLVIQPAILVILWPWNSWKKKMFLLVMVLEIVCFVLGVLEIENVAPDWDEYPIGRWVYGVFQILVWVKWAGGSYILSKKNSSEFFGINPHGWGILVYSSAFFLNAVLAGVRCKWDRWPWLYLFSKKHVLPPSP